MEHPVGRTALDPKAGMRVRVRVTDTKLAKRGVWGFSNKGACAGGGVGQTQFGGGSPALLCAYKKIGQRY